MIVPNPATQNTSQATPTMIQPFGVLIFAHNELNAYPLDAFG